MIITGGEARGRRIASPEGITARPTASKIRQALFNILGARVRESNFLDIFAGSGLIGLEALSRGAETVTYIEENRKMTRAIEVSLNQLSYRAEIHVGEFRQIVPRLPKHSYDIIFADPPYNSPFARLVTQVVDRAKLLKEGGVLVVEHLRGCEFPGDLETLEHFDTRFYGQTGLSFFKLLKTQEDKLQQ
jgi:16S rRNA (guanine(966)-N(2))-methyltransferase RsmD